MHPAYSYVRFSSTRQEQGDSLRRQVKLAESYAKKHGLDLSRESFQDLGISAFKGRNAAEGKLKTFLDAVDKGAIPKGSYLLIESIDRLSRNEVDEALELFLSIIRRGITIVTLTDEQVYSKERIKQDKGISLIISISVMARAHDESAIKSTRSKAWWTEQREQGKIPFSKSPAWLTLSEDRKRWIVDKKKAALVNRIFKLSKDGMGLPSIAKLLNGEKVGSLERGTPWSTPLVRRLLTHRTVLGDSPGQGPNAGKYVGYYPQIVTDELFNAVQQGLAQRRYVAGGKVGNTVNLFPGITYCTKCGSHMRVAGAGKYRRLICRRTIDGSGCDAKGLRYEYVEDMVLGSFRPIVELLVDADATVSDTTDKQSALEADRDKFTRQIDNLISQIADVRSPQLQKKINELQGRLDEVEAKLRDKPTVAVKKQLRAEAADKFKRLTDKTKRSRDEAILLRTMLGRFVKDMRLWCPKNLSHYEVDVQFLDPVPARVVDEIAKLSTKVKDARRTGMTIYMLREDLDGRLNQIKHLSKGEVLDEVLGGTLVRA